MWGNKNESCSIRGGSCTCALSPKVREHTLECPLPQENALVHAPPLQYYVFAKQNKVGVMYTMEWAG